MASRQELKRAARAAAQHAVPRSAWVTLVYLLLSSLITILLAGALTVGAGGMQNLFVWLSQGYSVLDIAHYVLGRSATSALSVLELISVLFAGVVGVGYASYALNLVRGRAAGYRDLAAGFSALGRAVLLTALTGIFAWLWALLFVIPGLVAFYRYRMARYVLLDDPDCGALEAIRRSKKLMRGHKWDLFGLDLSFIGWWLLAALAALPGAIVSGAFPILGWALSLILPYAVALYVRPWHACAEALFYEELTGRSRFRAADPWPQFDRF